MKKPYQNKSPLYRTDKHVTLSPSPRQDKVEAKFVTYLNTALWRAAKDQQKKMGTWKDIHLQNEYQIDSCSAVYEEAVSYETLFEMVESKKLYHGLKQLSHRQKFIMYKHAVELYTFKEIADQLGVSQQSVSKSYQRARLKLKNTQGGQL
ncbi:sigma-70 family RNA polymerase sigma factor [Halobacillus massiliensis]|uniref:sigma-70 family RNA polymerase sigma factor n=1 Tax=Halobacillus massiliensis TaxID=1926286 RepID=UPI0009E209F3|nr:sigma-70 family RNA polymerase sigma factor [Halobacillus massiliensis]